MEGMTVELLAFPWDVDPQASLTADGAGALNGKTNNVSRVGRRRKVDVAAGDIRMTSIVQEKIVDLLGDGWTDGTHDELS